MAEPGFFDVPYPVPDEMPAQLRPGAPAAAEAQLVATLAATGRWTPLPAAVEAARGQGSRGWVRDRYGMVRATATESLLGYVYRDFSTAARRAVMAEERDRILLERADVAAGGPSEATLDAIVAGVDIDGPEARERMDFGKRHERDGVLSLLVGMPRLRASASAFVSTQRGRRPADGERPLFGCSPDALGEIEPRAPAAPVATTTTTTTTSASTAPRRVCIEIKTTYGKRAPKPWRVAPYSLPRSGGRTPSRQNPMARHANYLVQLHHQMYVCERPTTLYVGWTGTGTRVFEVAYQSETWERTVAFVHDLLATGLGGPISDALMARANDLRNEYTRMTTLSNGVMRILDSTGVCIANPDAPGERLWKSAYTCETVSSGPAPTWPRVPGPAVPWLPTELDLLPTNCHHALLDDAEAAAVARRARSASASASAPSKRRGATSPTGGDMLAARLGALCVSEPPRPRCASCLAPARYACGAKHVCSLACAAML